MVRAVWTEEDKREPERAFAVTPPGVSAGDFSFLVLGDTGEGDSSQHGTGTSST